MGSVSDPPNFSFYELLFSLIYEVRPNGCKYSYNVHIRTRGVEAAISSTASTPIASASTNKKRENDRFNR